MWRSATRRRRGKKIPVSVAPRRHSPHVTASEVSRRKSSFYITPNLTVDNMSAVLSSTQAIARTAPLARTKAPKASAKRSVVRAAAGTVAAPAGAKTETINDCINTVRFLAIDAINKSNSGHPGLPMGCAPMGYVIFREAMTHNPKNTKWFNRDRFVLSAGHGCMLQYSLMHLTGYPSVSVRV